MTRRSRVLDYSPTPRAACSPQPGCSKGRRSRTGSESGLNIDRRDLLEKLKITALPQSGLVTVQATESSPKRAALLANAFAGELIAERTAVFQARVKSTIARLEARSRAERRPGGAAPTAPETESDQLLIERLGTLKAYRGGDDPTLEIWSAATPPDAAKPRSLLVLVVIFLAAALLAAGAGLAFEFLSPRIRRRSSLPPGFTILATVPSVGRRAFLDALVPGGELPERFWDGWRLVRARLVAERADRDSAVSVLVTSPSPGEGKTEAAACLAVTLAASGIAVALVDANLRSPEVAELFGVETEPGLADVLEGRLSLRDALAPVVGMPGLRVLPAGSNARERLDLLEPTAIAEILAQLKREAEVIVIDAPALTGSAEAVALTAAADAVIVNVSSGRTRVEKLTEVATTLDALGTPVLGLVLHERKAARGTLVPTPRFQGKVDTTPSSLRSEVA
jgi:succinoglycan biosynthesis transport protein ExoP